MAFILLSLGNPQAKAYMIVMLEWKLCNLCVNSNDNGQDVIATREQQPLDQSEVAVDNECEETELSDNDDTMR